MQPPSQTILIEDKDNDSSEIPYTSEGIEIDNTAVPQFDKEKSPEALIIGNYFFLIIFQKFLGGKASISIYYRA